VPEARAARDKEMAESGGGETGVTTVPTWGKGTEAVPLDGAPPYPLCGGHIRPEFANDSRLWVCTTIIAERVRQACGPWTRTWR
jgi:hypothetical protein